MLIELPFPPASLSGHNTGHWRRKAAIVKKHRQWAYVAALVAGGFPDLLDGRDLRVITTFYPPNKRGDRLNFPVRMKPYYDGIANALNVNDSRFVPVYQFGEPEKPGRVVVEVVGVEAGAPFSDRPIASGGE